MSDPPMFLVDSQGRIEGQNREAERRFGRAIGRYCRYVVGADDGRGRRICRADCARELHDASGEKREDPAVIAGRRHSLVCTSMGTRSIVALYDAPEEPVEREVEALTPREAQVLELVAAGLTSGGIARRLGVSASTVRTHVERAREKLGARSRAEAVAVALRSGQLTLAR